MVPVTNVKKNATVEHLTVDIVFAVKIVAWTSTTVQNVNLLSRPFILVPVLVISIVVCRIFVWCETKVRKLSTSDMPYIEPTENLCHFVS